MVLKLHEGEKRMVWGFKNVTFFTLFVNFWWAILNMVSEKARQNLQDHLNPKLVLGNILGVTKFKPFSAKARKSVQNFFKSKFFILSFSENCFSCYLELKSECSEHLVMFFFSPFCSFLGETVETVLTKARQSIKNGLNQRLFIGSFSKNGFQATLLSKTNVLNVWQLRLSLFSKF